MNKHYRDLIFTDHARERSNKRSITKGMVYQAVHQPHKKYVRDEDTIKFIKTIHNRKVHVVANYLENEKKWLIISVWVRGEEDKAPFVWRLITFPFWLVWKLVTWLFKLIFKKS